MSRCLHRVSLADAFLTVTSTFCANTKNATEGAPNALFLPAPRCLRRALSAIMGDERLLASLDLMRRMPPSRMENSLEGARDRRASARIFQSKHLASHGARLNTSQHL